MPDTQPPENLDAALRRKAQEAEMADNLAILRSQPEYQAAHPAALERWRAAPPDAFRKPEEITKSLEDLRHKATSSFASKGHAEMLADAEAEEAVLREKGRTERREMKESADLYQSKKDSAGPYGSLPRTGVLRGAGYVVDTNEGTMKREDNQVEAPAEAARSGVLRGNGYVVDTREGTMKREGKP